MQLSFGPKTKLLPPLLPAFSGAEGFCYNTWCPPFRGAGPEVVS
jgi:hypothetical protein